MSDEKTVLDELKERFGDNITQTVVFAGDMTAVVKPEKWVEILKFLKDESVDEYDYMSDLCCVDHLERQPRFDVVVHLLSMKTFKRIRIKTSVGEGEELDTLCTLWKTANWHEREAYDLLGIRFKGHPNLERILLPDDFLGHPLRKDYPLKAEESAKKQEELRAALKSKEEGNNG
ncbi:NADH-quinone oxidoreductase subunit C [bacterium]|nr:NADH-quinone oxidoreductase subunit C [bacterium]